MPSTPTEEAPPQTLRYRASLRLAYSVALLLLLEYARESGEDFTYGPLLADPNEAMQVLEEQGLVVSGPRLEGVRKVLDGVSGLYLSDD